MRPKTEELLYFLLWTAATVARPTWRNLNDSFETWAWRNGLGRRLAELQRQQLLECHPAADLTRLVRLTDQGRRLALGGRDPDEQWGRRWDGTWRVVLFDIPTGEDALRQRVLRILRQRKFGYLQKSVWVSPDSLTDVRAALGQTAVQAEVFLILEGRPAAGESDAEIVSGAWDFTAINQRYDHYLKLTRGSPPAEPEPLIAWARRENAAWKAAVQFDPFLPVALLPSDYRGREAWRRRLELFSRLHSR